VDEKAMVKRLATVTAAGDVGLPLSGKTGIIRITRLAYMRPCGRASEAIPPSAHAMIVFYLEMPGTSGHSQREASACVKIQSHGGTF
jgi:hypothetical protein